MHIIAAHIMWTACCLVQLWRSAPAIDFKSAAPVERGPQLAARDLDQGNVLMLDPQPVVGWRSRLERQAHKQPFGKARGEAQPGMWALSAQFRMD